MAITFDVSPLFFRLRNSVIEQTVGCTVLPALSYAGFLSFQALEFLFSPVSGTTMGACLAKFGMARSKYCPTIMPGLDPVPILKGEKKKMRKSIFAVAVMMFIIGLAGSGSMASAAQGFYLGLQADEVDYESHSFLVGLRWYF